MGIRKLKPTTQSSRYYSVLDFKEITEVVPHKPLTANVSYKAGRDNKGRISVRRKGGQNKKKIPNH